MGRKPRDYDTELYHTELQALMDKAKKQPEAVARWTKRGQAFFQAGVKSTTIDPAVGTGSNAGPIAPSGRAAD